MNQLAYINGKVLVGQAFHDDLVVIIDGPTITSVLPANEFESDEQDIIDLAGNHLIPGYIDIQVNGGGGVLFNDSPTVDGIRVIAEAHRQFGTTGLMPTLISDDLEVVNKGLAAVDNAIEAGVPGVLGIHIEGPFLNLDRRGIHDASKIAELTDEIVRDLQPLKNGCTMLTIAPETMSPELIGRLIDKGFILCAGHSNASYAEVGAAIDQGLSGFTHLYNAMSQLSAREPGMVGAALDYDNTWCGIIADGHHVSSASLRIAYRCKTAEKLMLVTDAMPPVGAASDEFELMGNRITVQDGVCVDAAGTLAGAALDMATAVRNMMQACGCSLAEASRMASTSPAEFLGLQQRTGAIKSGMRADLVVLDSQFKVVKTLIAGQ